jgi:hypothetical protein
MRANAGEFDFPAFVAKRGRFRHSRIRRYR